MTNKTPGSQTHLIFMALDSDIKRPGVFHLFNRISSEFAFSIKTTATSESPHLSKNKVLIHSLLQCHFIFGIGFQ